MPNRLFGKAWEGRRDLLERVYTQGTGAPRKAALASCDGVQASNADKWKAATTAGHPLRGGRIRQRRPVAV